jgi:hypothetical protein
MKAFVNFLQKLINLPDQHPPKPLNISNQIQINVDPLAQYHLLQELSQLSHNNDNHFDLSSPTPLPKRRPLKYYKKKGKTVDHSNNDRGVICPLIKRRCAVPDPEIYSIYDDSSSDDDSDGDDIYPPLTTHEDDDGDTDCCSPPVVRKRPARRAFINHDFVEAANLSCNMSPLSPEDYQYFTPIKLTIYHSCNASDLPIVIDSGASATVTPVLSDFFGTL